MDELLAELRSRPSPGARSVLAVTVGAVAIALVVALRGHLPAPQVEGDPRAALVPAALSAAGSAAVDTPSQSVPIASGPAGGTPDATVPEGAPAEARTAVEATRPKPLTPRRNRGRIVLRVHPWAEVTLDGRTLGSTPLPPVEVAPGIHTVLLVNGELGARRTVTVRVRGGRDAEVRVNLLE
ncbi:MAG: hypothetical protein HY901_19270 [Deltaproteobacteria bacterium]|nr:hypothetical protein [Deltaproteobacteria bacterium]